MKVIREAAGETISFLVTELSEEQQQAARLLGWSLSGSGAAVVLPSDARYIEEAYENFERYASDMLRDVIHKLDWSWNHALERVISLVSGGNAAWYLVGSTALAVRGIPIIPGDIDLATDYDGARILEGRLAPHLVQPMTFSPDWIADWFGRAYLDGGRVEWVGNVNERADHPRTSDFGPIAAQRLERVEWREHMLRVPPLDLQLAVNRRRGLTVRVEQIETWMQQVP